MADKKINLQKNVISNQRAKEILAGTFNEVIISDEKYDSEKIKGIYNDLFFQIPKKGKKSHTTIIEQSTDSVYPEININLEDSIANKEETLLETFAISIIAVCSVIVITKIILQWI